MGKPKEQLPLIESGVRHYREMLVTVETRADQAEGDTRIPIAMSSEMPFEVQDKRTGRRYLEVLDHNPSAIDASYARDGLPLLLDHDQKRQVGIVDDLSIGTDHKMRGMVRMGNHPDAAWVEKDLRGGIRKKISLGYDPGPDYTETGGAGDELPTRTYRGWRPMEVSSVAVPADYEVGVGRSAGGPASEGSHMEPEIPVHRGGVMAADEKDVSVVTPAVKAGVNTDALEQRQKEVAEIYTETISAGFDHKLAGEMVTRGLTLDQARSELFQRQKGTVKPTLPSMLDMPASDQKRYSVTRAIMASATKNWAGAGLEQEASLAIMKRLGGKAPQGFYLPEDLQVRTSVTGNIQGTSSLGGASVQTTLIGFIDLLRARMVVEQAGATVLAGLTDTVGFVRQLTANTFQWVGENPSTAASLTSSTMDLVTLTPRDASAGTAYSRRLLAQSSIGIDAYVLNDLAAINSRGIDAAALIGTGTTQPMGIVGQTGVTIQTLGANGIAADWPMIVTAETNIAAADADQGGLSWVTNPTVRGKWKTTLKSTTAGSFYLWADDNSVNGYRALTTTQIPKNLTVGTGTTVCSEAIFGYWPDLVVGYWGGTDIVTDPYTYALQGMIQISTHVMVDATVKHPKSFNVMIGILTA